MARASGLLLILSAAGIAAYAMPWRWGETPAAKPEPRAAAAAPQRPEPVSWRPVGQQPETLPPRLDRASLARELQRELKRVGCYEGEINGVWTTSSRMAMKTFTDRVNATLPIEQPDYILLSLVKGHPDNACGTCPEGQVSASGGRCVPRAILAAPPKALEPDTKPAASTVTPDLPAVALSSSIATASKPGSSSETKMAAVVAAPKLDPKTDEGAGAGPAPLPPPKVPPVSVARSQAAEEANLAPEAKPPARVHQRHVRRALRRGRGPRPPKFVRSLIRSVQRSLAPFGIR